MSFRKIAYFDCQFGAAGDMLLAALLDSGSVDQNAWLNALKQIALPHNSFSVVFNKVSRCSLQAGKLEVLLANSQTQPDYNPTFKTASHVRSDHACDHVREHHEHGHQQHKHEHGHDHHHKNGNDHSHGHDSNHGHQHDHENDQPERHLSDILQIIDNSLISENAKQLSTKIFRRLAAAEAQVHGNSIEEVHFHEVGAIDAIVDIIGFAIAYDMAEINESCASAVPLGSGTVLSSHGKIQVPGPAVVKLITDAGARTSNFQIPFECLTPTGAAILCEIAAEWERVPAFDKILSTGYGAGNKDPQQWPNVCRVIIGVPALNSSAHSATSGSSSNRFQTEQVAVIEANIDDQSPQAIAYAVDRLWEQGALDVSIVPALMKKGRSGHLLTVVCDPSALTRLQELIMCETTSLGARAQLMTRLSAERSWVDVKMSSDETVRVKIATDKAGNILNVQPEFEDLAALARSRAISIKEAQRLVMTQYESYDRTSKEAFIGLRQV